MPLEKTADPITGIIPIYFSRKLEISKKLKAERAVWPEEPPYPARMEESLWKAVIIQAIYDAVNHCRKPHLVRCKELAMHWLMENSPDFIDVCHRANLDPVEVRRKAKKALMNPNLWRTQPGQSERYLERQDMRSRRRKKRARERIEHQPQTGCIIFNVFA